MAEHLGRTFPTFVRSVDALRALVAAEPHRRFQLPPGAKRVVTFLQAPPAGVRLPIALDGAEILGVEGAEAVSAYVPGPRGPVFMKLIEKTFGERVTTRTWETVKRLAR